MYWFDVRKLNIDQNGGKKLTINSISVSRNNPILFVCDDLYFSFVGLLHASKSFIY